MDRPGNVNGWLSNYTKFTGNVAKVRSALISGSELRMPSTYKGTAWEGQSDPWISFADELLRTDNGVTGTGQSVLSRANFRLFCDNDEFVESLSTLIKDPKENNYIFFLRLWNRLCEEFESNRNPLLVNRVAAACTLNVTSTVSEANFDSVFSWLKKERFIENNILNGANWYSKNVFLMEQLRVEFADMRAAGGADDHSLSVFVWQLYEHLANPFNLKKQVVKYGAPGTGKTYSARVDAGRQFAIWKNRFGLESALTFEDCCDTIQFHPSFGYEDFMEGLRPELTSNGTVQLTLQNGIFKRLCMRASSWEKDVAAIPNVGHELAKKWGGLKLGELSAHKGSLRKPHWHFIHEKWNDSLAVSELIPPFFLIIDEINRAELSRVLGELMICLEYRGISGAISTQYSSLNTNTTGMLDISGNFKFFVPHNVYIIGTMNTIDRSVESFDLALRRRFRWERLDPDINLLRRDLQANAKNWVQLADSLSKLNEKIASTDVLGVDYQIGHAYLMNLRYPAELTCNQVKKRIWEDSIRPLLEEYLRGLGDSKTKMIEFEKAFGVI